MKLIVAIVAGYVLGTRLDRAEIDEIRASFDAIRNSDEFRGLVASLRSHAGHTLRELATIVEDGPEESTLVADLGAGDLIERVRGLTGRRGPSE